MDVSEAKLGVARELGATQGVLWAGTPEETADAVREATGGGVDYAIEATGRPEAMTAGSSPGTSEIARVTTRAGWAATASRPPE